MRVIFTAKWRKPMEKLTTSCCIAGGGPAGMMLAFLLARDGIDVLVLEKHADFLRDFRGDTIHPSTLEVLHELLRPRDGRRALHAAPRSTGPGVEVNEVARNRR